MLYIKYDGITTVVIVIIRITSVVIVIIRVVLFVASRAPDAFIKVFLVLILKVCNIHSCFLALLQAFLQEEYTCISRIEISFMSLQPQSQIFLALQIWCICIF